MEEIEKSPNATDRLFFLGLAVGLVHYMIPEITLEVPEILELFLKALMFFLLTLQLIIAFPKYAPRQRLLIISLFFVVVIIGYNTTHWGTIYSLYALIIGAKDIDFHKILKVYFLTGASICITVVLLSYFGIIENRGFLSNSHGFTDSEKIRYCMGYIWPTDFASHVFFVLLSYWMLKDARMTPSRTCAFLLITYLVFYFSDSQLGCGCIILLVLSSYFINFKKWLKERHPRMVVDGGLTKFLWVSYIPFLFLLLYWMTASYDPTDLVWIALNTLLSGRLQISQEALEKEGYTLFGQDYKLIGGDADPSLYNFIDSSYLQSLIIYGIFFSIAMLLIYMYVTNQAYKRKDYTILYAIFVAGISGAIAQHFLQVFMNPLWLTFTANTTIVPDHEDLTEESAYHDIEQVS